MAKAAPEVAAPEVAALEEAHRVRTEETVAKRTTLIRQLVEMQSEKQRLVDHVYQIADIAKGLGCADWGNAPGVVFESTSPAGEPCL